MIFWCFRHSVRLVLVLGRKHTRLNQNESESQQTYFHIMTANVVNTLPDTLTFERTYILRFLRGSKYKYGFPHNLNKLIYQSLNPYTSKAKLFREQSKRMKLFRYIITQNELFFLNGSGIGL